jgi:hypothetical protein
MNGFSFSQKLFLFLLCISFATTSGLSFGNETVQFNRDVLPILSDKCFACHGPDSAAREKDMRFDIQEGLFSTTEDGQPLIVPGDLEESEIHYRISHEDPEERMPPEDFHLRLSEEEIDIIGRWIEEGASWEGHWAFIPPVKPDLPAVPNQTWPKNSIDHFILNALEDAGLTPADEAGKETLIRRISLDLTGLPPTIEEVDAFLADESDNAYATVVDRLLESPHYGERMAFPWLDEARYSDTNGYQRDTKRTMWAWRDWVIQAFNENMPYDQFTIEQLAGDLLPNATLSQKIATGFNRNHRINGEGGIIPEEYAVEYVVDRVTTTSTAFMGLTMSCARCHDHKFDSISQKEFYEMYAFFNRVPEQGKGGERGNDVPFIKVPTAEDLKYQEEAAAKIALFKEELFSPDKRLDKLQRKSEKSLSKIFSKLKWDVIKPDTVTAANGTATDVLLNAAVLASGDTPDSEVYELTFSADQTIGSLRLEYMRDKSLIETGPGRSTDGNVKGNVILTDIDARRRTPGGEWQVVEIVDAVADYARMDSDYAIHNAIDDDKTTGWSVGAHLERANRTAMFVLDSAIEKGDEVRVTLSHESPNKKHVGGKFRLSGTESRNIGAWARPELGDWHSVGPFKGTGTREKIFNQAFGPEAGYKKNKTYGENELAWTERPEWVDGTVIPLEQKNNSAHYLHRTITAAIPSNVNLSLGSDDAVTVWLDGEVLLSKNVARGAAADQESLDVYLSEGSHDLLIKIVNYGAETGYYFKMKNDGGESLLALMKSLKEKASDRSDKDRTELQRLFRMQDSEWLAKNQELPKIEEDLQAYEQNIPTTMIMEEMAIPPETYLLTRGVYDQPDTSEQLYASVPALLGEMDESLPKNRLGFARWLTAPDHPLTARVRVNQYWHMLFGQGIVKTGEDFGTQSTRPSHPGLLDYLATDFIESGWDVKRIIKQMVMSATYRQSSVLTNEHAERDPENILLGRAPRFRLSAEKIRDQALYVSGLMNPEIGGPSVFPYQPDAMWSSLTFQNMDEFDTNFYRPDTGDKLYRRGLYTYWKRTIAPPRMQIFDAPDRERCSMRQDITNTPIQAMVLLNDPTFVEASRKLAERMLHHGGKTASDRVRFAYKSALAHEPDSDRLAILESGLTAYLEHFTNREEEAKSLIAVGDSAYDENLDETELAAYTMLASVLFNLDEMITRE